MTLKISPKNNPTELAKAWNALVEDGDQTAIPALTVLDIPDEKQRHLRNYLDKKYPGQLSEDPELIDRKSTRLNSSH